MKILIVLVLGLFAADASQAFAYPTASDTIKTESGLQYFFVKHGTGKQIENGSKVYAYNKLYVADSLFWSTDNLTDSSFSFVMGKTSLIKGANELYPKLREGDVVVAIMPDSIAYGEKGFGEMPGGATLVFNPIIIKKVTESKIMLGDTLTSIMNAKSVDDAISFYEQLIKSEEKEKFHLELDLLQDMLDTLYANNKFKELEFISKYFGKRVNYEMQLQNEMTKELFGYYTFLAYEKLEKYKPALDYIESMLEKYPDNNALLKKFDELQSKVNE